MAVKEKQKSLKEKQKNPNPKPKNQTQNQKGHEKQNEKQGSRNNIYNQINIIYVIALTENRTRDLQFTRLTPYHLAIRA